MGGCCKGDSSKTNAMCNSRPSRAQCERSSSCTFVEGGVLDEGDCDFGTTQPPDEPGCCYGNPDIAYSKRWMEQCKDYGTERECLMLEDADGNKRCTFGPMNDYMDCEAEWPTTTQEPGCCKADSPKREDMCLARDTREKCERSASCVEWISGPEADCSIEETTTEEPGCCYINPDQAYSKKYQDTCITFGTERECLKLTDSNGV